MIFDSAVSQQRHNLPAKWLNFLLPLVSKIGCC